MSTLSTTQTNNTIQIIDDESDMNIIIIERLLLSIPRSKINDFGKVYLFALSSNQNF